MLHQKKHSFYEIQKGFWIAYSRDPEYNTGTHVSKVVSRELGCLRVKLQNQAEIVIPYTWYQYTLLVSPDCIGKTEEFEKALVEVFGNSNWYQNQSRLKFANEVWTLCERHYGIGPEGSSDPDPIRDLALKILRGDPIAMDAARDVLRI